MTFSVTKLFKMQAETAHYTAVSADVSCDISGDILVKSRLCRSLLALSIFSLRACS